MTPSSRRRMTASRSAVDDGGPDLQVVEQLLLGLVERTPSALGRRGPPRARTVLAAGRPARCGRGIRPRGRRAVGAPHRPPPGAPGPPRSPGPLVATTPSRRTSHGRVRPWPTSVARMTQNVRKMTRSRSGKSSARRERRRQRDRAAHPRPRDDEDRLAAAATGRASGSACSAPGQVGRREDPHEPRDDDRQADHDRVRR